MKGHKVIEVHDGNDDDNDSMSSQENSQSSSSDMHVKGRFKRKSSWISSSFDDFGSTMPIANPRLSKRTAGKKEISSKDDFTTSPLATDTMDVSWVEKHQPKSETELAVHKKKVSEIRDWLCQSLSQKSCGILLLTGPSGCGKTASLHCLCNEMGVDIQEWLNPEVQTQQEFEANRTYELMWSDSQSKQFQDFLFRANKYSGIAGLSKSGGQTQPGMKHIICVEDLPPFIYKDTAKFHGILRQYRRCSRNPLVFILSDSVTQSSSLHSLFPKYLQVELKTSKISLNPIATTTLTKTLTRIAAQEARQNPKTARNPSKHELDLLVASCSGDIRSAINSLQFLCSLDVASKPKYDAVGKLVKRSRAASSVSKEPKKDIQAPDSTGYGSGYTAMCSRDTSLYLFRALGKILYCKREPGTRKGEANNMPNHLKAYARDRLLIDPDDVIEKTRISGDTVSLYLHQNFLDFHKDIDDVIETSRNFSDADELTGAWTSRDQMSKYAAVIVPRAVAFHANRRSYSTSHSTHTWKPLNKPQFFDANRETMYHCEAVRDLFSGFRHSSQELRTELLPFMAKINPPLQTPSQISLLQTVTSFRFGKSVSRPLSEPLAESESGISDPTTVGESTIQIHRSESCCSLAGSVRSPDEAEETRIEDFDD